MLHFFVYKLSWFELISSYRMNHEYTLSVTPQRVSEIIIHNNPTIKAKIVNNCRIKPDNVIFAIQEIICFLDLIFKSKKSLTPSLVVDLIWHEFILFTRLYVRFCEQRYGRYIHHHPGGPMSHNQARFSLTLQLYKSTYGEPDPEFWGFETSETNSECGSCDTQ